MTTKKLINISSSEYDKAEATAFLQAVVAPVLVSIVAYFIGADAIISPLAYTLLMAMVNLHRGLGDDAFLEEKSMMYFEYLKYLFVLYAFVALLLIGGRHV